MKMLILFILMFVQATKQRQPAARQSLRQTANNFCENLERNKLDKLSNERELVKLLNKGLNEKELADLSREKVLTQEEVLLVRSRAVEVHNVQFILGKFKVGVSFLASASSASNEVDSPFRIALKKIFEDKIPNDDTIIKTREVLKREKIVKEKQNLEKTPSKADKKKSEGKTANKTNDKAGREKQNEPRVEVGKKATKQAQNVEAGTKKSSQTLPELGMYVFRPDEKDNKLNVRSGLSLESEKLGHFVKGDNIRIKKVVFVEKDSRIRGRSRFGWVSMVNAEDGYPWPSMRLERTNETEESEMKKVEAKKTDKNSTEHLLRRMASNSSKKSSPKSSSSPKKQDEKGSRMKQGYIKTSQPKHNSKEKEKNADDNEESESDSEDENSDEISQIFEGDEENTQNGEFDGTKGSKMSQPRRETENLEEQNENSISGVEKEQSKTEKDAENGKKELEENKKLKKLKNNQIPTEKTRESKAIPTEKTRESKAIPIWGWVCIALSIVLFLISVAGCCGYLDACCCCGVPESNPDDNHTQLTQVKVDYKDVSHQELPRDLITSIDVNHEEFGTLSSLFNDDDLQKAQDDICGIRNMQNELKSFEVEDSAQKDAESSIVHAREPKPTLLLDDFIGQKLEKEKNEESSSEIQQNLNNIEEMA